MNIEPEEHPYMWISRKSHKTHFRERTSRSSYLPKSNTPGLYDGSAEARAIVNGAQDQIENNEKGVAPSIVLLHVLHYLKGMDSNEDSWTKRFFEKTDEPTSGS